MSLDQQFNTVNDKLQQLLKQHNRLQKENEKLKEELQEAKSRDREMQLKMEEFQQQISILKFDGHTFTAYPRNGNLDSWSRRFRSATY